MPKYKKVFYQGARRAGKTFILDFIIRDGQADSHGDVHEYGCFKKAIKNMQAQEKFDELNSDAKQEQNFLQSPSDHRSCGILVYNSRTGSFDLQPDDDL